MQNVPVWIVSTRPTRLLALHFVLPPLRLLLHLNTRILNTLCLHRLLILILCLQV